MERRVFADSRVEVQSLIYDTRVLDDLRSKHLDVGFLLRMGGFV